jgi:hypothetical protein
MEIQAEWRLTSRAYAIPASQRTDVYVFIVLAYPFGERKE